MNVVSLFDGIGSSQVALQRARVGYSWCYASEINKDSISVCKTHFPFTRHVGSVTDLKRSDLPEKVDLLLGGSPCLGFSNAGKRLNFSDPQSKLFFEFVRLLKECKPTHFLLENVRMKKEWQDIISSYLDVEPIHINSSLFSAQDRKRSYWTNIKIPPLPTGGMLVVQDILEWDVMERKYYIWSEREVIKCDPGKRKVGYIGSDSQGNRIHNPDFKGVCLCGDAGGLGAKTGLYAIPCKYMVYPLDAYIFEGIDAPECILRKLTPVECERMMTLPDNYTRVQGLSDNKRYKMLGNGWTIDVIAHILKGLK